MIKNAQDIIEKSDIVTIVESRVSDLEKKGVGYEACCPFHKEKTPSFKVSPVKGIYKCFGCGKAGNAINFLMEYDQISFPEAIREAANMMNLTLEYEKGSNWQQVKEKNKELEALKERYYNANKTYHKFHFEKFIHELSNDVVFVDLDGRKYSLETIKSFGVCITSHKELDHIPDKEALRSLGLLKKSNYGDGFYQPMMDRILFPVIDKNGNIAGFTARRLNKDGDQKKAKYVNSQESEIYNKSELLYGIHKTASHIRDRGLAYVVEGTTDVLTLYDLGIKNVVASCGTAINELHAQQLSYLSNVVILLLDGDTAGKNGAKKCIEHFLKKQMEVRVCELPEGQDPDSYLRSLDIGLEEKLDHFKHYSDDHSEDAILWHVREEYGSGASNHLQIQAMEIAADYLALLDSDIIRAKYIKKVNSIIGYGEANIKRRVLEVRNENMDAKRSLSSVQKQDALKYGICEHNNKYYTTSDDRLSIEITNFIIKPIMLAIAPNHSSRIIEVVNEHRKAFIKDVSSDIFTSMEGFKKEIARRGHYLFKAYAKAEHFVRITDKVYADCRDCYQVPTYGWSDKGLWFWGNGISVEGKFIPVDEYGVVQHDDINYFLPAFSRINTEFLGEDPDGADDFASDLIYKDSLNVTVKNWAAQFYNVHSNNGMVGIAYYLAALFRDIIYKELDRFFPHLNLFGPQGSGKSYMAWSMSALFGIARQPFYLDQGTDVGFYRRIAQIRNGICWYDEYSSDISQRRAKAMKGFADGTGREKGRLSQDNKTSVTRVNSAVIISGQFLPNQDPALMERCITLFFQPISPTAEQIANADELKAMEEKGVLSQVTNRILSYRQHVKDKFRMAFQDIRSLFRQMASDGALEVKGRLVNNFSAIATIFYLINDKEEFPFTFNELMDFMFERLKDQVKTVKGSDELTGWWSMIEYLAGEDLLKGDEDYSVKDMEFLTVETHNKEKKRIEFEKHERIIFLRMNKAHKLYLEHSRKQGVDRTLDRSALDHYLTVNEAYLGKTSQRFDKGTQRCWAFLVSKTNAEFHPTFLKDDLDNNPSNGKEPWE